MDVRHNMQATTFSDEMSSPYSYADKDVVQERTCQMSIQIFILVNV